MVETAALKPTTGLFTIDNVAPTIIDPQAVPSPQEIYYLVNISANVTDDHGVMMVFVNITYPDGTHRNFSILQNTSGHTYYSHRPYDQLGTYYYFIWAADYAGNADMSTLESFVVHDTTPPEIKSITINPEVQETAA